MCVEPAQGWNRNIFPISLERQCSNPCIKQANKQIDTASSSLHNIWLWA